MCISFHLYICTYLPIRKRVIDCTVGEITKERARPIRPRICPNPIIKSNNVEIYTADVNNTGLDFSLPNNLEISMELIVIGITYGII